MKINRKLIENIIRESLSNLMEEEFTEDFDNVAKEYANKHVKEYGTYDIIQVPEYCLPYLVNGDMEEYSDAELDMMQRAEEKYSGKLINGLSLGDVCIPEDDVYPSFCSGRDDILNTKGIDCYTFFIPLIS